MPHFSSPSSLDALQHIVSEGRTAPCAKWVPEPEMSPWAGHYCRNSADVWSTRSHLALCADHAANLDAAELLVL